MKTQPITIKCPECNSPDVHEVGASIYEGDYTTYVCGECQKVFEAFAPDEWR